MSNETIMLAKDWEPKKFVPGSFVSQKLDGVPIKMWSDGATVHAVTRQGEDVLSVDHIRDQFHSLRLNAGCAVVGEVYMPGHVFKDISGLVRSHSLQPGLQMYLHDVLSDEPYMIRYERMLSIPNNLESIRTVYDLPNGLDVHQVFDISEVQRAIKWAEADQWIEGIVIRNPHLHPEPPGTRSWGIQRFKPEPTIDLRVHSFEEAVSKTKEPLGMVGRINVHYKGEVIGVGPGKLSHVERTAIWQNQLAGIGLICEVKYMRDPSYTALRQPTFQRWRPDKDTPDA